MRKEEIIEFLNQIIEFLVDGHPFPATTNAMQLKDAIDKKGVKE